MLKNFVSLVNSVLGGSKKRGDVGLKGTGYDKLQGDYELKLINCLKFFAGLAMKEMAFIEDEKDKINFAKEKMEACRLHMTGDHRLCIHENARCKDHKGYLLEDRAGFGAEQRAILIKHLFTDKVETEAWLKDKLIHPGNTSDNENYHSLMVTRGLVNKDARVDVQSNTIDAKYALGTYFFNCGATETYSTLFNHDEKMNWKICKHSLGQIQQYEKRSRTNAEKMKKKKRLEAAKRAKQVKWQCNPKYLNEPGTYITSKQKRRRNPSLSLQTSHRPKKNK